MPIGKHYDLDIDTTLTNNSDTTIASQKAVKTYVDNGLNTKEDIISDLNKIRTGAQAFYVKGTQTASTNAFTGTLSAIDALYEGLTINYWLPYAGTSTAATLELTLADGTTTGAVNCYYSGTTRLTTHLSANCVGNFIYQTVTISGENYTGWWLLKAYYSDSNTYDREYDAYYRAYAGIALPKYCLTMKGENGRLYPLVNAYDTVTTKAVTTTGVRPDIIWYYTGNAVVNAGSVTAKNTLYRTFPSTAGNSLFNSSLPTYCDIYLCGSYDATKDLFYLATTDSSGNASTTDFYRFVPYNTEPTYSNYFIEGRYYIFLGSSYSTANYFHLMNQHPMYYYDGTNLIKVSKKIIDSSINNNTITIQKNGTTVDSFTLNQNSDKSINIAVPTTTDSVTSGSTAALTSGGAYTNLVRRKSITAATGGENQGVYVDANGQVQACNATTSTYSSTGTTAVNGTAVASALGSYIPKNFDGSVGNTGQALAGVAYGNTARPKGYFTNFNLLHAVEDKFFGADRSYKLGDTPATITCNYSVANMVDGSYSGHNTSINPSTAFSTTPFVWQITRTSQFEATDVCNLYLVGHRLTYTMNVTAYKLEVAYSYSNGEFSWGTLVDYSGTAVNILNKHYGVYYANHGGTSSYHGVFGIRLTISGATSTAFDLTEVMLLCSRGNERVAAALNTIDGRNGGKVTGDITIPIEYGSFVGNLTGNADTATTATTAEKVLATVSAGSGLDIVRANVGGTDNARMRVGGTTNAGYLELATADDGNEPIYVRQYTGIFSTEKRTATLLDASGNTSFPGSVTANGGFIGDLTGTASKATADADGNTISTTYLKTHQDIKTLNTTNTTAQTTSASEDIKGSGTLNLHKVSKTGSYTDLNDKPTIPTVNNNTITIQKNSTTVDSFTLNQSSNKSINITVPTTVAELSDSSDYVQTSSLEEAATVAKTGDYNDLINKPTIPQGTVTSVRVQATSPVQSSTSTEQTTSLNTTISLADAYGDTKNPYGTKTANYVLAGPSSGSAAAPSFRALTKDDIPLASETASSGGTTTSLVTTGEKYTWNNKQNALTTQTAYTSKGTATKVPQITTNTLGQVTGITEVDITHPTEIPSQSGNSGKFLTTNGSTTSWASVPAGTVTSVRVQAGTGLNSSTSTAQNTSLDTTISIASGYKLPTTTEWGNKQDALPSQSGNSGKFLTTNGSTMSWGSVDALPSQSGQSGKYLTTNGTTASWGTISIPTVNDAVLAIQQNGLTITTFSANASTGATVNIGTTIVKFRDWSD